MAWRKVLECNGGQCLEVDLDLELVSFRDSKLPNETLTLVRSEVSDLVKAAKAGDLDYLLVD